MIFPPFVRSFWEASLIISQNPFTQEDSRSSRKDRVTRLINSCIEDNFVSIKYPGTWHLRRPGGGGDLIIRVSRGIWSLCIGMESLNQSLVFMWPSNHAHHGRLLWNDFRGKGTPENSWWGCAVWFSISDQKSVIFPNPFLGLTSKIHTRFQTWPLGKKTVIIT